MKSRILNFKRELVAFCKSHAVPVYHNESLKEDGDYGVWYEMGHSDLCADDRAVEKSPVLSVQFWIQEEYSSFPELFEGFLDELDVCWDNQTWADYDGDSFCYHYGWTVEL